MNFKTKFILTLLFTATLYACSECKTPKAGLKMGQLVSSILDDSREGYIDKVTCASKWNGCKYTVVWNADNADGFVYQTYVPEGALVPIDSITPKTPQPNSLTINH